MVPFVLYVTRKMSNVKSSNQVDEQGFLVCSRCGERKEYATAYRNGAKQCKACNRARDLENLAKTDANGMRHCKRCGEDKALAEFSPGNSQCRPCKAQYTATKMRNSKLPPEKREELVTIKHVPKRERKYDESGNRWCWQCQNFVSAELFKHERTMCTPCSLITQKLRRRELRIEAVERGLPPRKNARQESGPKTCTECGETKPFEAFRVSNYQCKACRSKAYQEKYWSDPETYRSMFRERYAADAERQRQRVLAYWALNPEIRTRVRKNWVAANPAKQRIYSNARRARQVDAQGAATVELLMARMDYYGHKCWMCGYEIVSAFDHVQALCNGGSNWPANFRPACWECNSQKAGWEKHRKLSVKELHELPLRMREERAKSSKPRREIQTVYTRRKVEGGFAPSFRTDVSATQETMASS